MRAVIQRVHRAQVTVAGEVVGRIDEGLCAFIGAGTGDGASDVDYIAGKIANLRVFTDDQGKMNRSLLDTGGGLLAVSQFTLYGDARRGRRPTFTSAMEPAAAEELYLGVVARVRELGVARVATGTFRATMDVELVNAGPVTVLLDSRKSF
jgi:D-aminoacyl-tRNA deacylase